MLRKTIFSLPVRLLSVVAVFTMACSNNDLETVPDCSASDLSLGFENTNPSSCAGGDGTIVPVASGGAAPYQFALNNGPFQEVATFGGMGSGTYSITVKDKNGCVVTEEVELEAPDSDLTASVTRSESGCNTSTGVITVNPSGGSGGYTFAINGAAPVTSGVFTNLAAGSYSVKITDSDGCSVTRNVKVLSGITFSNDIKQIIDTNCAITGCHVSGSTSNFTVLANIQSSAKEVRARTQSGNMPRGRTLTKAQIDAIACWVDDGALDN